MIARIGVLALALVFGGQSVLAQGKEITLAAPGDLATSGFLKYLLPRFSLKTGIRVNVTDLADAGAADIVLGPAEAVQGTPVMRSDASLYSMAMAQAAPGEFATRFADWLVSETGQRTINTFAVDGAQPFQGAVGEVVQAAASGIDGDADKGLKLSVTKCGRCHVVGEINKMKGIGSTPSFALMRTFGDWENRFRAFYVLKPHPAFTQVADLTPPFDETHPPPIAPVELTLDDLDAILAFVSQIEPADLGKPLQSQ